jgi:hypothetical protein
MLQELKILLAHQFDASLATLNACIQRCPEALWHAPVANNPFCQSVFHVLFFVDYYLESRPESFREQAFHREQKHVFADYEQLADREPVARYERQWIKLYLQHVRGKAAATIAAETSESLQARCGFPPKTFSRAELYVYNIRHLQHHAAQLSLRLRLDARVDIPWFGSGWREVDQ